MAYDAEDAVQETYLRLWQMRARIGEYHYPEALATMIAKNICIDILKQHSARVVLLHETLYAIDDTQTDQLAIQHDVERLLKTAMRKLPTTKRKMLLMRSDGMSMEEIAAACGTTAASAKTMICAARKELVSILKIRRTEI
jgi:RNA polymerase sigma-70 factor (ECF subfamily)